MAFWKDLSTLKPEDRGTRAPWRSEQIKSIVSSIDFYRASKTIYVVSIENHFEIKWLKRTTWVVLHHREPIGFSFFQPKFDSSADVLVRYDHFLRLTILRHRNKPEESYFLETIEL